MTTGTSPEPGAIATGDVQRINITRMTADVAEKVQDIVVREFPLTIMLNGEELVTLLCSPAELKYLAIGFLYSEGLLKARADIKRVVVDERKGVARVETTAEAQAQGEVIFKRIITPGCGRGASFYSAADSSGIEKTDFRMTVSSSDILSLMNQFQHRSLLYRSTHGVHSAALCDSESILVFTEDIGRHNAIDKIFGQCLDKGMPVHDRIILTSGRMSSEIVIKVARRKVPILISKSAPTDAAVRLADELGLTLVGLVRGTHLNVYAHDWRVTTG
jgi:FdhD protein